MSKENIKLKKGFTIIETVLVLAIAGLIMALVFLALPALQTGQRDQARKQDVNNVNVAIAQYAASNNGNFPTSANYSASATNEDGTSSAALSGSTSWWKTSGIACSAQTKELNDTNGQNGNCRISVINGSSLAEDTATGKKYLTTNSINPNTNWIWVVTGRICNTDSNAIQDTIKLFTRISASDTAAAVATSRFATMIELEGAGKAIYCVNN